MDYLARIEWRHVYRIMYGVWTGIEVGELPLSDSSLNELDNEPCFMSGGERSERVSVIPNTFYLQWLQRTTPYYTQNSETQRA